MYGFFKRNCLGLQKFIPPTQSLLVCAARSRGDLSSWHWNSVLGGPVLGLGLLVPEIAPSKFLSTTCGCRTSPFHIYIPTTSLDGSGFFNSVAVRLPFNSISDCSKWWLLYISIVTLMWLCEGTSHVYLHLHLDWTSGNMYFLRTSVSQSQCLVGGFQIRCLVIDTRKIFTCHCSDLQLSQCDCNSMYTIMDFLGRPLDLKM